MRVVILYFVFLLMCASAFSADAKLVKYRITPAGSNISSVIVASAHVGLQGDDAIGDESLHLLKTFDTLVIERDVTKYRFESRAAQALFAKKAGNFQTLSDVLVDGGVRSCTRKMLEELGLYIEKGLGETILQVHPAFFLYAYVVVPQPTYIVNKPSIDKRIVTFARENGKAVIELETLEEFWKRFFAVDAKRTAASIEAGCEAIYSAEKSAEIAAFQRAKLLEPFLNGSPNAVRKAHIQLLKMLGWNDDLIRKSLHERDTRFAEKIADLIKSKRALIVIGFAHLEGEGGVIENLSRMGHVVRALE